MAIQPIDLSVIYSQMDNVAKFSASQNQQAQAANQAMINKTAQDRLESSKAVKAMPDDNADTTIIKNDLRQGSSGGDALAQEKKERKSGEGEEDEETPAQYEITDPSLGQHIDITG